MSEKEPLRVRLNTDEIMRLPSWIEKHEIECFAVALGTKVRCKIELGETYLVCCAWMRRKYSSLLDRVDELFDRELDLNTAHGLFQDRLATYHRCTVCDDAATDADICDWCRQDAICTVETKEHCVACRDPQKAIVFKCLCNGSAMCQSCVWKWLRSNNKKKMSCIICKDVDQRCLNLAPELSKRPNSLVAFVNPKKRKESETPEAQVSQVAQSSE